MRERLSNLPVFGDAVHIDGQRSPGLQYRHARLGLKLKKATSLGGADDDHASMWIISRRVRVTHPIQSY